MKREILKIGQIILAISILVKDVYFYSNYNWYQLILLYSSLKHSEIELGVLVNLRNISVKKRS